MNHLFPQNTQYAYRLDDLEKKWYYSGNRNYVSYANLKPGEYRFLLKAQNDDGYWQQEPTSLVITVNPPFWQTWWFVTLEIILVLVLIGFFNRYWFKVKTNRLLSAQNAMIRETNQKLKESERHLKHLNATKDKFFSIVAHDLKNPFTSLLSISDVMVQNYELADEEEKKACIERVHHSLKHLYSLLENLLTWSRAQTGRLKFEPSTFNLSAVVQENTNLYKLAAEKKEITLEFLAGNEIKAFGDREMINTVVRNLVGNAIKFTPVNGKVSISINERAGMLEIGVTDTGVGITPENVEKLFRIDEKVKTMGTDGEKGTGLGLILCKEFVRKNGGDIKVRSVVTQGTTFSFTLPKP